MTQRRAAWMGTAVVAAHAAVSLGHGFAHERLEVHLSAGQWIFVLAVITIAPLIAGVLLWTAQARRGAALLALSMIGGFLFGLYYHYGAVSPDNVSHLPEGDYRGLFRWTALLLAILQALGAAWASWAWRALGRAGIASP